MPAPDDGGGSSARRIQGCDISTTLGAWWYKVSEGDGPTEVRRKENLSRKLVEASRGKVNVQVDVR